MPTETDREFAIMLAETLKFNFPELGTDEEMDGADVVEALVSLYEFALKASKPRRKD